MPMRPPRHKPARLSRDYRHEAMLRQQRPEQVEIDKIRGSGRWQRVRRLFLATAPLCTDPYRTHLMERRVQVAQEVDHIIPLAHRPDLAFTFENLQGLCLDCHARKSQEERRQGYHHQGER